MTEVSKAIIHILYHWRTDGDIINMRQASVLDRFENCVYSNPLPVPGQL